MTHISRPPVGSKVVVKRETHASGRSLPPSFICHQTKYDLPCFADRRQTTTDRRQTTREPTACFNMILTESGARSTSQRDERCPGHHSILLTSPSSHDHDDSALGSSLSVETNRFQTYFLNYPLALRRKSFCLSGEIYMRFDFLIHSPPKLFRDKRPDRKQRRRRRRRRRRRHKTTVGTQVTT
jgi:hypothetical protein